ncbi:2084_t:CDS:2, partial [Racocetra persica]
GSRKRSWIWDHFEDLSTNQGSKGRCKELKKDGTLCNHMVETDGGTGNFSDHLQNKHGITKFGRHESYVSQLMNNEKSYQIKDNAIYKEQVDKVLVEFIVTDSQPFYMLENPGFIKYSLALSLSYKLPSNKGIKSKIYLAYDWMSAVVRTLLDQVVCSNINKNHEYLQAIADVPTRWDSTYLAWPFANATKILGGSKYSTMSFMFTAISSLKKLLDIDNNVQITVDLDDSNTVFDDDLDLQEDIEFIDEPEILDIEMEKK